MSIFIICARHIGPTIPVVTAKKIDHKPQSQPASYTKREGSLCVNSFADPDSHAKSIIV